MEERLEKKNAHRIRRKVGVVFQDPDDQVFSPTVWDDVCFGPVNLGLAGDEIEQRCFTALGAVGMLDFKDCAPYELSYGQRKRVAIAGVLAMQPDIVILDEPMAYLDPAGQDEVRALLEGLHFMGKTIVVTTHDVNFAAEWADQIVVLKEGRVCVSGTTDILVQEEWIAQARLHYPIISRPFLMLPQLKLDALPKTEREAAQTIFRLFLQ
jgi:cobalt/nickel transport system ATP-binding protein